MTRKTALFSILGYLIAVTLVTVYITKAQEVLPTDTTDTSSLPASQEVKIARDPAPIDMQLKLPSVNKGETKRSEYTIDELQLIELRKINENLVNIQYQLWQKK